MQESKQVIEKYNFDDESIIYKLHFNFQNRLTSIVKWKEILKLVKMHFIFHYEGMVEVLPFCVCNYFYRNMHSPMHMKRLYITALVIKNKISIFQGFCG